MAGPEQAFRFKPNHRDTTGPLNPDPTKMSEPCAIVARHFNGDPKF